MLPWPIFWLPLLLEVDFEFTETASFLFTGGGASSSENDSQTGSSFVTVQLEKRGLCELLAQCLWKIKNRGDKNKYGPRYPSASFIVVFFITCRLPLLRPFGALASSLDSAFGTSSDCEVSVRSGALAGGSSGTSSGTSSISSSLFVLFVVSP